MLKPICINLKVWRDYNMKNVKYRFKQIDRIGKVFGEKFLEDERYISGNIKDNRYIKLSNTNYNDRCVYTL